jgi:hypothetical protein
MRAKELVDDAATVAIICLITWIFVLVMEPAWPVATAFLAMAITVRGWKKNPALTSVGLVLYIASWFMVDTWGSAAAIAICGLGIMIWIAAPFAGPPCSTRSSK